MGGKKGPHDCAPASDNSKVHRCLKDILPTLDRRFALVLGGAAERGDLSTLNGVCALDGPCSNGGVSAKGLGQGLTEPDAAVEVVDGSIAALHHLVDGGIPHLGLVLVAQCQGLGGTLAHQRGLVEGQGDLGAGHAGNKGRGRGTVLGHGLRQGWVVDLDTGGSAGSIAFHTDDLGRLGLEQAAHGVVGGPGAALNDHGHGQQDLQPVVLAAGQVGQPGIGLGQAGGHLGHGVDRGAAVNLHLNTGRHGGSGLMFLVERLDLLGGRIALLQRLNKAIVHVAEDFSNGLVGLAAVVHGNGTLKNAHTLKVLLGDTVQVLGVEQRVLLEVGLEVVVEDGDEVRRLAVAPAAHSKEVLDVLAGHELDLGTRQLSKGLVNSSHHTLGVFLKEVLGFKQLGQLAVAQALGGTHKHLVGAATQGGVDPALLVRDPGQRHHAANNLGVGHLVDIAHGAVSLATEVRLLEVRVEALDDRVFHLE
eukprot:comp24323_c2_seq1/m.45842 comp24323_c2_seq1/g.45842  ORF comp24323_c2_seq1/g.45842 comp24323_c2_seq1/m.45842 type:complete len:476 (+) comp24323_c2_seq1:2545-3972(+)